MPRGASRFDTAQPGSPSTWEYILRAEKATAPGSPTNSVPRVSTGSPPASPTTDLAKLDALMRQATKERDGKLSYEDWAEVMRRASA